MSKTEKNQELAAAKAGMDRKTARDYLDDPRLPSECVRIDFNKHAFRARKLPGNLIRKAASERRLSRSGAPVRRISPCRGAASKGSFCRIVNDSCRFSPIPITRSPLKPITHSPSIPISVLP